MGEEDMVVQSETRDRRCGSQTNLLSTTKIRIVSFIHSVLCESECPCSTCFEFVYSAAVSTQVLRDAVTAQLLLLLYPSVLDWNVHYRWNISASARESIAHFL